MILAPAHRYVRREDRGRTVLGPYLARTLPGVRSTPAVSSGPQGRSRPSATREITSGPNSIPGRRPGVPISGRPRTFTLVISGLFLAVLALTSCAPGAPAASSARRTRCQSPPTASTPSAHQDLVPPRHRITSAVAHGAALGYAGQHFSAPLGSSHTVPPRYHRRLWSPTP